PDVGTSQAGTRLAEQFPVRRHAAVAAFRAGLAQALAAAAVQPVVVGQVRGAQVLVALAVDAVAGHAHALVELLALGGHEVVLHGGRIGQGAHVGDGVVHRFRATHAGQHGAPLRHDALAAIEDRGEDLLRLPAPVPDVVGQVRVADRALARGTVAGGAGVAEDRAAQGHRLRV